MTRTTINSNRQNLTEIPVIALPPNPPVHASTDPSSSAPPPLDPVLIQQTFMQLTESTTNLSTMSRNMENERLEKSRRKEALFAVTRATAEDDIQPDDPSLTLEEKLVEERRIRREMQQELEKLQAHIVNNNLLQQIREHTPMARSNSWEHLREEAGDTTKEKSAIPVILSDSVKEDRNAVTKQHVLKMFKHKELEIKDDVSNAIKKTLNKVKRSPLSAEILNVV